MERLADRWMGIGIRRPLLADAQRRCLWVQVHKTRDMLVTELGAVSPSQRTLSRLLSPRPTWVAEPELALSSIEAAGGEIKLRKTEGTAIVTPHWAPNQVRVPGCLTGTLLQTPVLVPEASCPLQSGHIEGAGVEWPKLPMSSLLVICLPLGPVVSRPLPPLPPPNFQTVSKPAAQQGC